LSRKKPAPSSSDISATALGGLRVLDLTSGRAGHLAAWLLADQGAEVVRPGAAEGRFTDRGTSFLGTVDDATLAKLAAGADVVLEDAAAPRFPWDAAARPALVHLHLPPFAPELLGGAAPYDLEAPPVEGALEAVLGLHDRPLARAPAYAPLALVSTVTAAWGAVAAVAGLIARQRDGYGQNVRVAHADAATELLELTALLMVSPPRVWASLQWASTPFIGGYPTADGVWFYVHAGLDRHLARMERLLRAQVPEQAGAFSAALSDVTRADPTSVPTLREGIALRRALAACFAARPAEVWERLFLEAGLCGAVIRSPEAWRAHPHARASGQVVHHEGRDAPGVQVRLSATPGVPRSARSEAPAALAARWKPRPRPTGAEDRRAPLAGLRVLDFTQVIAGPVAGRTLAALGAEVHRVENPHFKAPWVEAFHLAFNAGKTSEVRDLASEGPAAARELLRERRPDVLLQNLRPGAAGALGIDEASARAERPELVYAHLTAWGEEGPWGRAPGWEQTAQAACGIQATWGGEGPPDLYPLPCNDVITGLMGAFASLLGVLHQRQGGPGQRVGSALSATATLLQAHTLFDGEPGVRGRAALGPTPLRRFYKAQDGWLFLAAADDALDALASVPGLGAARGKDGTALIAALERAFAEAPVADWRARVGGCLAPRRAAVLPWVNARSWLSSPLAARCVHRVDAGELGAVTLTRPPAAFGRSADPRLGPAPTRADLAPERPKLPRWLGAQVRGAAGIAIAPWLLRSGG
jgi:crotonobetainyl-CoA:carnitine CoA-transferase CaiB-like acyl-CoA transferase